ncbi:MAG: long-chain-fatty-acid--CoA ligase [Dehalococcoidia bacterium]|nr:long-chain-fatty-acid--CoA ligase [Dehalococcoidia bacterium]
MNVAEFLLVTSAVVPDREAVIFEGRRITFAQLNERANRLANGLAAMGVGKGDRIATVQVNCNELAEAAFAAAKLDAVYVPMNFRAKADEIQFMINDAEPKAVLIGKRYYEMMESIQKDLKSKPMYLALEGPYKNWVEYEKLLVGASPDDLFPSATDEDLVVLMFTAGTTGTPKGVMLTHNSFSSYIVNNVEPVDPGTEEKNILTVPMYHIAGLQAVMAGVYGGRTLVVQRQFDPEEWMNLVKAEKVDRAMMVPTMLKQLIEHPKFNAQALQSLKVITYGAAPMPLEVIKRAIRLFPTTRFINAFGQTETASTITMLPPDAHDIPATLPPEEQERRFKRLGSIGRPLQDVEVRIVDEVGNEVSVGQQGEIVARGQRLMKGYWKREAATKETIRGGWLYTGDLGYRDDEGYIYLSGRSKDFIKRGGEMVAPEEVEQTLMSHPAVDEAAIIGVPDADWGERVRAIAVRKPGASKLTDAQLEAELIEYCRQRLSSFKKPESVVFVKELPRNPMGKVLKRVLREQFSQPVVAKG